MLNPLVSEMVFGELVSIYYNVAEGLRQEQNGKNFRFSKILCALPKWQAAVQPDPIFQGESVIYYTNHFSLTL